MKAKNDIIAKTKLPLSPREQFIYVNLVQYNNGSWGLCWYAKYLSANNQTEAIQLRKALKKDLCSTTNRWEKGSRFKTIKICLKH